MIIHAWSEGRILTEQWKTHDESASSLGYQETTVWSWLEYTEILNTSDSQELLEASTFCPSLKLPSSTNSQTTDTPSCYRLFTLVK